MLLVLLAFALGCQRELDPQEFPGGAYFPLEVGRENIYQVLDSSYKSAQNSGLGVRRYFRRELVSGFETDLQGRKMAVLDIFESPDSLGNNYVWAFVRRDQAYLGGGFAERVQENTRYLLLKLPGHPASSWNGNQFNHLKAETCRFLSTDTIITIGSAAYPDNLFVEQVPYRQAGDSLTGSFFLIEHAYEAYAPGIGKLLKYRKYFEVQNGRIDAESFVTNERLVATR